MTNKEAIASLRTLCHNCELFPKCVHEKPECFQAIELAISALQAQEIRDLLIVSPLLDKKKKKRKREKISALQAQEAKRSNESSLTQKKLDTIQEQDVPDTNVGKMDGDELDEAIRHCDEIVQDITWFCNSPSKYIEQRRHESAVKLRQLASWLRELKRLRTEVYFLKAEKENEPVDLLGDVPCKTCKWRVTTTEKCEECIDGVSDNYEVQEPCEDCVSRQAAIDAAWNTIPSDWFDILAPKLEALPSAQPEYELVKAEDFAKTMSENTLYTFMAWHCEALELMERQGFVICKKTTRFQDRRQ